MIVKPKQYVSAGPKWQQFIDYINLKPGQENLPLKFTILNGSSGTPPLKAINATLSGRNFFSQKDFQGKRKLSINLTNALTAGSTQIVFQPMATPEAHSNGRLLPMSARKLPPSAPIKPA